MHATDSRGISWTAGFFMLIAFVIAGLTLVTMLSVPVWTGMTGKELKAMGDSADPADANAFRIIHLITMIGGFFIPTLITAAVLNRRPLALLGFSRASTLRQAGLVVLIVGVSIVFSSSLSYLNHHIAVPHSWKIVFDKWEESYTRQVEAVINLQSGADYVIALLLMAVLPAVCEETLFRGGLQNFLTRGTGKPWLSIVIVSLLFSLAHFSFYGFLYRFFLGMVLGAVFHYSGKLWLSILAHFLNNAVPLTILYVYLQQGKSLSDTMQMELFDYGGLLALPVLIGLFILFKKTTDRQPV